MTPVYPPADLVEAAARVLDPDAFEIPSKGYSEGARVQSAESATATARAVLEAVLPAHSRGLLEREADALQDACGGSYNPDACETCRAVESLRESADRLATGSALASSVAAELDQVPWIIRNAVLADGKEELDEVVAKNADIHFEAMGEGQWWAAIRVTGADGRRRELHLNFGVVNRRAKTYAHAEDQG